MVMLDESKVQTPPKERRLAAAWERYLLHVLPKNAPSIQVTECRRAFFAGAESFFDIQNNAYDGSTPEPTEADLQIITDLNNELIEFGMGVKAGRC